MPARLEMKMMLPFVLPAPGWPGWSGSRCQTRCWQRQFGRLQAEGRPLRRAWNAHVVHQQVQSPEGGNGLFDQPAPLLGVLTSPQTTCTRDVCSSTAAFAEARRSWFLPFKTTAAPRWAQAMAMALPMPRLDPVTTTTLSVRSGRRWDEVVMCRVGSGCQDDASTRSSCWSTPWPHAPKTQSKWFPTPR